MQIQVSAACRRLAGFALASATLYALMGSGGSAAPVHAPTQGQRPPASAANDAASLHLVHRARAIAPGEVVVLSIEAPEPLRSVQGRAFGQRIAAFTDAPPRWEALVGVDVETAPGTYTVTIDAQTASGTRLGGTDRLVVAPRRFPVRRLTVDPAYTAPPAAVRGRIEREQRLLSTVLAQVTSRLWHGPFERPVDGAAISAFGAQSIFNGKVASRHRGADFASPAGAPVRAPNGGRVVLAQELYFSGNTVILDHGCGLFSLLAHLSRIDVKVGDEVAPGATVGAVGATGRVTGPHLHWTVRIGAAAVDPLSLMEVTRSFSSF